MRHHDYLMLPLLAFQPEGGRMRLYSSDSPPPPDYTPLAEASAESARIMGELGKQQLDFAERQYEEAKPLIGNVVDQQMAIANKTSAQGDDYYSYLKSYRPAEQALLAESMGLTPDMMDALRAEQNTATQGILSGLVDEAPYQAELEAARIALGGTPQQRTSTTSTPANASPFGFGRKFGSTGPTAESIKTLSETNPDFAAALAKLTDSQKQAMMVSAQNSALREQAETANADVFSKYSGQAARSEASRIAADRVLDEADAKIIGGTDSSVLDANRGEIEAGVGRAVADSQGGFTRSINQIARQGLRYGNSGAGIAAQAGSAGMAQASQTAAAANAAREQGIMGARGRAGTNMGLRRDITGNVDRQRAIGWAKKLDAAGLVKGLPGASQGAYGLAVSAGNSAGQNQMAPGQQRMAGMAAGAGTIGQGRSMYQQGLGSILNSQTTLGGDDGSAGANASMFGTVAGIGIAI